MPTQRNTQNDGRTGFLHVRIEPAVLNRFREVAESEHRTVSQEVRRYIDQRIAEADASLRQPA
jgi:hypothetical protein